MPPGPIKNVQTQKGINLQKLAEWVLNALKGLPGDDRMKGVMKWFTICLAGGLLFPYTDNIVEEDQLSTIWGIWNGKGWGPPFLLIFTAVSQFLAWVSLLLVAYSS